MSAKLHIRRDVGDRMYCGRTVAQVKPSIRKLKDLIFGGMPFCSKCVAREKAENSALKAKGAGSRA